MCWPALCPSQSGMSRKRLLVRGVAERRDVLRGSLQAFEQGLNRDALPPGVELRPLGDAVDVAGDLLGGERPELLPRPSLRLVYLAADREVPLLKRRAGRGACREYREAIDQVLAWREAVLALRSPAAAPK